ncbi:MAG: hypothetical protein JWN60_85 [Acidobacteria bacterium]|nr:hypothetical protein [Acidobacteriota bacterium]
MINWIQIFSSTIAGIIIGAIIWSIIVFLIVYKFGEIHFGDFFGVIIEPGAVIIFGTVIGVIQGFFIGLVIGIFSIDTIFKGGLTGVIATEIVLLFCYIIWTMLKVYYGLSLIKALSSLGNSGNFIIFSILLFIPAVIIGIAITKTYTFAYTMISTNN